MNIVIVMATCNGARFIEAQLRSILGADLLPSRVIVGDDASNDDTLARLREMAHCAPVPVEIHENTVRMGVAANFLSLLRHVPADATCVAFADQDDIWHADKLARAVAALAAVPAGVPALYCARQRLIDASGAPKGLSPLHAALPSFANALVENIATGCTVLVNRAALDLVLTQPVPDVRFHDWYLYLLLTGVGGLVIYDPEPVIDYRQHGANVTGSPVSLLASLRARAGRLLGGSSRRLIDANMASMQVAAPVLTAQNRAMLASFAAARAGGFVARLAYLPVSGLYRQCRVDTWIMRVLFAVGRL